MTTPRRGLTNAAAARSRGPASFLHLVSRDPVLPEFLVQIAPGGIDRPRGARDVPAVLLELPPAEASLGLVLVVLQGAERGRLGRVEGGGGARLAGSGRRGSALRGRNAASGGR